MSSFHQRAGYNKVYLSSQTNPNTTYIERDPSANSPSEEEDKDSTSIGQRVIRTKSQATRRSTSPHSDLSSVLMVLGTSSFHWYGRLTILARSSKVKTSTPFEIGTRSLLTSPSVHHENLRNVTIVMLLTSRCTSRCSRLGLVFLWGRSTIVDRS